MSYAKKLYEVFKRYQPSSLIGKLHSTFDYYEVEDEFKKTRGAEVHFEYLCVKTSHLKFSQRVG